VIAEDHHMFCKCYFAALWELAHAPPDDGKKVPVLPRVKVQPVYLPAVSYLVESSEGSGVRRYIASCYARFQQARRHMQGIVELGYVLLQYFRLVKTTGFDGLPKRTHAAVLAIAAKMHTLHITSTAQCFALIMAAITTFIPTALRFILDGGLYQLLEEGTAVTSRITSGWGALNMAQQALASSISSISGVVVIYSITCFVVMMDLFEGRYYKNANFLRADESVERSSDRLTRVDESVEEELPPGGAPPSPDSTGRNADVTSNGGGGADATRGRSAELMPAFVQGPMSLSQRVMLFMQIFNDTATVGYAAITFYAMIPVLLAGWSLIRRGTDFEYIVALKPTED
jgi:hypothetical protein